MSLTEILEVIRSLPQVDKLQLLHELVNQVTLPNPSKEAVGAMMPGRVEVVSPVVAPATAAALAALLAEDRRS
jgi:hypothetical protein